MAGGTLVIMKGKRAAAASVKVLVRSNRVEARQAMSSPLLIRVIVVDDHPVVRFGLTAIIGLQPDMLVVAEAGSGEEACAVCAMHPADIVLMDLRLPGLSGVETIRAIQKLHLKLRFIVLTTYDGDEDIHKALEAGAHAYLLKGLSHNDLVSAIRTVHAGLKFIPASVSRSLAERPPQSELSARELEVLEWIVRGRSNREIGEHHSQPAQRQ
jgi:two-component system NarL family response regulator